MPSCNPISHLVHNNPMEHKNKILPRTIYYVSKTEIPTPLTELIDGSSWQDVHSTVVGWRELKESPTVLLLPFFVSGQSSLRGEWSGGGGYKTLPSEKSTDKDISRRRYLGRSSCHWGACVTIQSKWDKCEFGWMNRHEQKKEKRAPWFSTACSSNGYWESSPAAVMWMNIDPSLGVVILAVITAPTETQQQQSLMSLLNRCQQLEIDFVVVLSLTGWGEGL